MEKWKLEVVEANIEEWFDSQTPATARFDDLVKERFDDEIVTLYQIGSNGAENTFRTSRGERKRFVSH